MVFGIGSGIFFIYMPFLKVNHAPVVSFRPMPGKIFKRTASRLGQKVYRKKFSNPQAAQAALDQTLFEQKIPVGLQVGVYHLSYFPPEYRFHFNAHNIVVFGKEGNEYLVSDPVMDFTTRLSEEELERVRFAKGVFAPHGQMYYPSDIHPVSEQQLKKAIAKGISASVRDMIRIPGPIVGVSGIRFLSKHVRKWREKHGLRIASLYLGQLVRMQEEIGTGGGGFRFLYGAFLQQAAVIFLEDELRQVSEKITNAGDRWRDFAIQCSRIFKGTLTDQQDFNIAADMLLDIADLEKDAFTHLSKVNLKF
jgi:hypothetical protein